MYLSGPNMHASLEMRLMGHVISEPKLRSINPEIILLMLKIYI